VGGCSKGKVSHDDELVDRLERKERIDASSVSVRQVMPQTGQYQMTKRESSDRTPGEILEKHISKHEGHLGNPALSAARTTFSLCGASPSA